MIGFYSQALCFKLPISDKIRQNSFPSDVTSSDSEMNKTRIKGLCWGKTMGKSKRHVAKSLCHRTKGSDFCFQGVVDIPPEQSSLYQIWFCRPSFYSCPEISIPSVGRNFMVLSAIFYMKRGLTTPNTNLTVHVVPM